MEKEKLVTAFGFPFLAHKQKNSGENLGNVNRGWHLHPSFIKLLFIRQWR